MTKGSNYDESRFSRRQLLAGGAGLFLPPLLPELESANGIPGPYKGQLVEVRRSDSVDGDDINRDAVRAMMDEGMRALTGSKEEADAWKRFFKPSDIVGIKLCLVGNPYSVSQPETVNEVIRGLNLAGVKNENIVLINRYAWEYEHSRIPTY